MRSLPPMQRKPKLGQNFLVSPTAPRAIVDALGDLSQATVLEIGPGKGALTSLLAPRAKQVIAVELDRALAASLQGSSVEVLCEDILEVDLTQLATERGVRLQVIGNLPYYISSPIMMHLFAHSARHRPCRAHGPARGRGTHRGASWLSRLWFAFGNYADVRRGRTAFHFAARGVCAAPRGVLYGHSTDHASPV